jgi:hypothetical protein
MSDSDDERGFWSRRVFAVAAVLVLLQAPTIVTQPTLAGMVGGLIGGVLVSLALVGVLKGVFVAALHLTR